MSRIGTCLQCGQRYADIPDSVTATRVKCKVCAGVVEIPPLAGAAPAAAAPVAPAAPAAAAAPPKPIQPVAPAQPAAPIRPVTPVRPAAAIPSKPIFAPKGAVPPVAPVIKPAATPAQPRVAATPVRPVAPVVRPAAPAPAPVARPAAAPTSPPPASVARPTAPVVRPVPPASRLTAQPAPIVRAAPPPAAAAPKPSAAEILAAAKAKRAAAQAAAAAPAPAAPRARVAAPVVAAPASRSGSRRAAREDREERESYRKPKSNTPLILTVVLVLVGAGAGGLWYMVNQSEEANEPAPAAPTVQAPPAAQPVAVPPASGVSAPSGNAAPPAPDPAPAAAPAAPPEVPAAAAVPGAVTFDANYVFVIPEAGKPLPVPTGNVDPARLTIEKAAPLQRWSKTSDATWTSIQADLALYLDNSGARSNRAGESLVKTGRDSYPAIVTAIMQQDYTTVDGVKMAGSLSDLVGKIVGESNFVWRSAERHPIGSQQWTETVLWQKKAAILRYNQWINKLREGDSEWEAIAKRGGASSRKDEDGNVVGDVPPDVPPDQPPPDGGR